MGMLLDRTDDNRLLGSTIAMRYEIDMRDAKPPLLSLGESEPNPIRLSV